MSLGSLEFSLRGKTGITPPPATTAPAITLHQVTKHYSEGAAGVAAVTNVSLEIVPGELTALMGPSGSGKTTLLSLMGGLLRPTSGRVMICGTDISGMTELERSRVRLAHIGFVFQSYNLFPTLTARQNVEIALDLKGVIGPERRARAEELLDRVDLQSKCDAYPADLSGGQKQRVAIARALVGSPSVILADEPTAALDSLNGRRIMKVFTDLTRAQQRAVVIVTHDSRIADFADRTLAMEDGLITSDTPKRRGNAQAASLSATLLRRPVTAQTEGMS